MAKIVRHSQYGCVSTVGISHECMSTKQFQDDRTRVAISPALSDEASEFLIDSWQSLNTVSGRSTELGILHDPAHDVSISDLPMSTWLQRVPRRIHSPGKCDRLGNRKTDEFMDGLSIEILGMATGAGARSRRANSQRRQ
jgi:hypothetical protein